MSKICELEASDAKQLVLIELGPAFAHANRCFCDAAKQVVVLSNDVTAHSSVLSLRAGDAAQMASSPELVPSYAGRSCLPCSSAADVPNMPTTLADLNSTAGWAAQSPTQSASLVSNDLGRIQALSLEQALLTLLQVDAATAHETIQRSFSAVFHHASICFCENTEHAANETSTLDIAVKNSSAAGLGPAAAAARSGAATIAAADSTASGNAGAGKAEPAGAGPKAEAGTVSSKAQSASPGADAAAASGKSGQASSASASAKAAASAAATPADGARGGGKSTASAAEAADSAAPAASAASSDASGAATRSDAAVTGAALRDGSAKAAGAGADSSAAGLGPAAAAARSGAATIAAADSTASGNAGAGKAEPAGAGPKASGSSVPLDFSSAAATGASKSRSCAFCACGIQ